MPRGCHLDDHLTAIRVCLRTRSTRPFLVKPVDQGRVRGGSEPGGGGELAGGLRSVRQPVQTAQVRRAQPQPPADRVVEGLDTALVTLHRQANSRPAGFDERPCHTLLTFRISKYTILVREGTANEGPDSGRRNCWACRGHGPAPRGHSSVRAGAGPALTRRPGLGPHCESQRTRCPRRDRWPRPGPRGGLPPVERDVRRDRTSARPALPRRAARRRHGRPDDEAVAARGPPGARRPSGVASRCAAVPASSGRPVVPKASAPPWRTARRCTATSWSGRTASTRSYDARSTRPRQRAATSA